MGLKDVFAQAFFVWRSFTYIVYTAVFELRFCIEEHIVSVIEIFQSTYLNAITSIGNAHVGRWTLTWEINLFD